MYVCINANQLTMNAHALTSLCTTIRIFPLIILFYYFRGIYDGWSYTGGYKQGWKNGKGEEVEADGSREIAYWVAGKGKEGAAKYYDKNGNEEDRFYKNGELVEQ